MSEGMLIVVLVVSGASLAGLVYVMVFVHRLHRSHARRQEAQLERMHEGQDRLARAMRPLVASGQPLDTVVTRLSFSESFDPEKFGTVSHDCAIKQLGQRLALQAADGVSVTVNGLRLSRSGIEMIVTASKEGRAAIAEGTAVIARHGASGRHLPEIQSVSTGQMQEIMKACWTSNALSKVAATTSVVVGLAHIISGADIARRLKVIDKKVDLLLACRRIDQMAILERIYTSARELSSGPMSRDKCWELWRLRGELRELRCTWRRELQHHLGLIDDPAAASWLRRTFSRQKTSDRRITEKITEGEVQLGMLDYSLRLDQVLAVSSGTIHEFEITLAGELRELDAVSDGLKAKAALISGRYPELSVEPTIEAMDALVEEYIQLLPQEMLSDRRSPSPRSIEEYIPSPRALENLRVDD